MADPAPQPDLFTGDRPATRFDRDIPIPPRHHHPERRGADLTADHKRALDDLRSLGTYRDSVELRMGEGEDPLRFMNRVTGYCVSTGGPGWASARWMGGLSVRVWKRGTDR